MKIVGGLALPNGVQLESTDFSVKTTVQRDEGDLWTFRSKIRQKTVSEKWVRQVWFLPKVVKLWVIILMKAEWPFRLLLIFLFVLPLILPLLTATHPGSGQTSTSPYFTIATGVMAVVMYVGLGYLFWQLRGFHAAEHMSIAAYERHGGAALSHIQEQPRFHPKCGGRIVVPLFVGLIAAKVGAHFVPPLVGGYLPLLSFELMLWIDALIGFDNIRLTNAISWYMQQYVSTRVPTSIELTAGQVALRDLMMAHQEAPQPKSF